MVTRRTVLVEWRKETRRGEGVGNRPRGRI